VLHWILVAVCAVLLIAGCVKKQQPWGKVLIVVALLGVLGVLVHRYAFAQRATASGASERIASRTTQQARLLGQGLKDHLAPGSRIVFMGEFSPRSRPSWPRIWGSWKAGISEGLGDTTWENAGYVGPAPGTAQSISQGLADAGGEFDAIVSFAGLPADLADMSIYQVGPPPKVAAYFPGKPDRAMIRRWIEGGLIHAAVLDEAEGLALYTPDNLP